MMLLIDELDRVKSTATMMIRDVNVPMGLENAHNTCYMNVLLQCLFHIDRFRKLMLALRSVAESQIDHSSERQGVDSVCDTEDLCDDGVFQQSFLLPELSDPFSRDRPACPV